MAHCISLKIARRSHAILRRHETGATECAPLASSLHLRGFAGRVVSARKKKVDKTGAAHRKLAQFGSDSARLRTYVCRFAVSSLVVVVVPALVPSRSLLSFSSPPPSESRPACVRVSSCSRSGGVGGWRGTGANFHCFPIWRPVRDREQRESERSSFVRSVSRAWTGRVCLHGD
ncbi:hypothetical protein ZHAS_00020018 [Anopheles sinensis]|uniref:Uncharacterized protein n=1 Tax=Anopheles sinensis TaxID=74873 RepID=A0A084WNR8_ANOSI|nr:hypothetical protein ZHAS_00020018 [Anopheles sinensis]